MTVSLTAAVRAGCVFTLVTGAEISRAAEPASDDVVADDAWSDAEEFEDVGDDGLESYNEQSTWFADAYPQLDRHFNLMTARVARPGALNVVVHHRVNSAIRDDPFHNYLGFDSGALKIGIGIRYGIFDGLDAGLLRLNGTAESFDTYQLDARYQFLRQPDHGVDLAIRLGASWFADQDGSNALKPFGQLIVDRVLFERVLISTSLMFHGDSSNPHKALTDTNWTFAAGVGVDARIIGALAWGFEISWGLAGYMEKYPAFTTGPKLITNRHTFALVITNTQYVSADGVITNTAREIEDIILGFTITREINLL